MKTGLRNFWYAVLRSDQLATGGDISRVRRLGEDLAIWQDASGTPHVFVDRCPHRSAPLSFGSVTDDRLRCGYHGLEFDVDGVCRRVPFDRADDGPHCAPYRATSYACEERSGHIWAYLGDGSPDEHVPPLELEPELVEDDYEWFLRTVEINANWLTVQENLCDPGHAPFLHAGTAYFPPDQDEVLDWFIPRDLPFQTEEVPTPSGSGVRQSVLLIAPREGGAQDSARYFPPNMLKIPVPLPGSDQPMWAVNYYTPIDETSTAGFFYVSRRVRSESEQAMWHEQWERMVKPVTAITEEQDVGMMEARELQDRAEERLLPQDGGIVRGRRLLVQMYEAGQRAGG